MFDKDEFKNNYRKAISEYKKEHHLTSAQMADKFNANLNTFNNWFRKDGNIPAVETLVDICDLLGIDIDYLLGRIPEHTHSLHYICKITKLNEEAASVLVKDPGNIQTAFLNALLTSSRLDSLACSFDNYTHASIVNSYLAGSDIEVGFVTWPADIRTEWNELLKYGLNNNADMDLREAFSAFMTEYRDRIRSERGNPSFEWKMQKYISGIMVASIIEKQKNNSHS